MPNYDFFTRKHLERELKSIKVEIASERKSVLTSRSFSSVERSLDLTTQILAQTRELN